MKKIVELNNICKRFGNQQVLTDINLCFEKGKIYGVIGPNGAGKTTVFKIIAGLVKQTNGEIVYYGGELEAKEARRRMSFMIETPYLDAGLSAYNNMKMLSVLYDVVENEIDELLKFVGLENVGKKKVGKFSLGMRQRLGIAMALLKKPELLVLDEPMNGLDPKGIIDIRNMLEKLCQDKGMSIVISSHILHELEILADTFYVFDNGKIIDTKSKIELSEDICALEKYYLEKIDE